MRLRSVTGTASVRPQISSPTFHCILPGFDQRTQGGLSRLPFCLGSVAGRAPLNVNRTAQQPPALAEQRIIAELAPRACGDAERSVTEVTSGGSDPLRSTGGLKVPTTPFFLSRRSPSRIRPAACTASPPSPTGSPGRRSHVSLPTHENRVGLTASLTPEGHARLTNHRSRNPPINWVGLQALRTVVS